MSKRTFTVICSGLILCWCLAYTGAFAEPTTGSSEQGVSAAAATANSRLMYPIELERGKIGSPVPLGRENIRPTYPLHGTGCCGGDKGNANIGPRGMLPPGACEQEPCEDLIYENVGGNSIGTFGDEPTGVWDDCALAPGSRFVCRISVDAGGVTGSGGTVPFTLYAKDGNATPICPEHPDSNLLFSATQNLQLVNPCLTYDFNIDPPILMETDFLWIGLIATPDPGGDHEDGGWCIAQLPELGFTEDNIVIPHPGAICENLGPGQMDDYYFYGGGAENWSGQNVVIRGNPGPPGACCDRDTEDPMSPGAGTCTDSVTRDACLVDVQNVWKVGLCADFDDTTPNCLLCLSHGDACAGVVTATPDDDSCTDGYEDMTNQGCESSPNSYSVIPLPPVPALASVCGQAGTFPPPCTVNEDCPVATPPILCVGGVCDGPDAARDSDWWQIDLVADTDVTIDVTARFKFEVALIDNGGSLASCTTDALDIEFGRACETETISRCLPPGSWLIRVRPDTLSGVPCDTRYRMDITTDTCMLDTGACCDNSMTGCTVLAEVACTGRGGQYRGDGVSCAMAMPPCPGVPTNDSCSGTNPVLTGVSVTAMVDNSFAGDSTTPPAVPANCSVGQPVAGNAIRKDVFYDYDIPTNFNGTAVSAGSLVISTSGSLTDTWIVVYGEVAATGGTQACGTTLCTKPQIECNDNAIDDNTVFKFEALSHIELDVEAGSLAFLDPGDCIKIRLGRGAEPETPFLPLGAALKLHVDFIPLSAPFVELQTGRCCTPSGTCTIEVDQVTCNGIGGYWRRQVDYNQGDPTVLEDRAGCAADPCPPTGGACFNAIDFNATIGDTGMDSQMIRNIIYYKYTVPNDPMVGGIVIHTCGSTGFYNPILGVYRTFSSATGDCNLNMGSADLIALNNECTSTDTRSTGALTTAPCYGGINSTADACLCISVGPGGDVMADDEIYIALGSSNQPNSQFAFPGSPRDIVRPVTDSTDTPVLANLVIENLLECFTCPAPCTGGIDEEINGSDIVCQNNPGVGDPVDLYNGGCNLTLLDPDIASSPSFNGPEIDCSGGPVTICSRNGNFTHPFPCAVPADCDFGTCDQAAGICTGTEVFYDADEDYYKITVDEPTTIVWKVLQAEFAPFLIIYGDEFGDCDDLLAFAFDSLSFPCEPPSGTQNQLEISASVCAGTYYLYISQAVSGGLGNTPCDANYVVEASCIPFVQPTACCPGDMNGDAALDGRDIQKWIETMFNPPTTFDETLGCFNVNYCRGDTDGNGLVEFADRDSFVDLLVTLEKPDCDLDLPVCTDPATGQFPFDQVGATGSDLDLNLDVRAAECICPIEDGFLDTLCFWGTYLDSSLSGCSAEPDCFQINFYSTTVDRCPGTRICAGGLMEPSCSQYIVDANRVDTGSTIDVATGSVTEFQYTATLPVPLQVTAGECIWIEITNNTPLSNCQWYWEQTSQGDTRHAVTDLAVGGGPGDLPSDYTACVAIGNPGANVAERDLTLATNLRISKTGCGKPVGRCCYDAVIGTPGVNVCWEITKDECEILLDGEWDEAVECNDINEDCPGGCGDPKCADCQDPACNLGRCCYFDGSDKCAQTIASACEAVDGIFTAGIDCTTACPTGRCCVDESCSVTTEPACAAMGGQWQSGGNCSGMPPCPSSLCNDITQFCQGVHVINNLAQGGYVTDLDNLVATADDFRPINTSGGAENFISTVCWRGFHKQGTADCGGGVEVSETFTITYYSTSSNLPGAVIAGPFAVTPTKTVSLDGGGTPQGVETGGVLYQYEAFHTPVPLTPLTCFWIEIQNTVTNTPCVFLWATSAEGGNKRAAVKSDAATSFAYQLVHRDLAFCVGPMRTQTSICSESPAIPAPANDQCVNATVLDFNGASAGSGTGSIAGSSLKATLDANATSNCGSTGNSPDVWYRWTQGAANTPTLFTLETLASTHDSVISIHATVDAGGNPLPAGGCPGQGASQINLTNACNDDGATTGLGTNQVFFRGRQARSNVTNGAHLLAGREFLIRVTGASKGGPTTNAPRGNFILTISQ